MAKITRMTFEEIDKEFTPTQVKAMVAKAKVSKDDNPITDEDIKSGKITLVSRGRPPLEVRKVGTYIRFSPDVLEKLRSTGKGWQTKLSAKITEWVNAGLL